MQIKNQGEVSEMGSGSTGSKVTTPAPAVPLGSINAVNAINSMDSTDSAPLAAQPTGQPASQPASQRHYIEQLAGRIAELERALAHEGEARVKAEHTLLTLQSALDRVHDGVMITEPLPLTEPGPRIIYANKSLQTFSGYSLDELLNRSPRLLQGPETSRAELARIHRALESLEPSSTEIVNYAKNGKAYWSEIEIAPVLDEAGRCISFVSVQRDTTEHRSMIEALQRERDFNTAIIQTSPTLFGVIEADGRVLLMNPALIAQLGDADATLIGKKWYEARKLLAGDRTALIRLGRSLARDKQPASVETRLHLPDGREMLIGWRVTPVLKSNGQLDFVFFSGADITAKRKAEEAQQRMEEWLRQSNLLLEQHVAERTRDLSNLLHASEIVNSTLELDPLLEYVLDQMKEVVGYSSCLLFKPSDHDPMLFELLRYRSDGAPPPAQQWRYNLETDLHIQPVFEHRISIIPDLQGDSPEALSYRNNYAANGVLPPNQMRSWMGVPLLTRGQLIGILIVRNQEKNFYSAAQANLALTFANQVAVALENARLFKAEQAGRAEADRRRQVAEGLSDILATLNSNRSLEQTLDFILGQAMQLLGASTASIFQLQQPQNVFRTKVTRGFATLADYQIVIPYGEGIITRAVQEQRPLWVNHLGDASNWVDTTNPAHLRDRLAVAEWLTSHFKTMLNVPVYIKGAPYGAIGLYFTDRRKLSQEELDLAMMIANQMALAIENAELRASSAQAAAMAERSRLARELHDSVSQALFGISLGTRTSLELLNSDPHKARDPMDYVLELADAGMAEMRALIFELRPESLQTEGLHIAFRKQAAALVARHKIDMQTHLNGTEDDLPIDVKEALYRIGLEAIQNTIKHAQAGHVVLRLDRGDDGSVVLEICDDGIGFDPGKSFPGHFGLKTMHERAEMLNGWLEVRPAHERGTCIHVTIPMPRPEMIETPASPDAASPDAAPAETATEGT